jgi:hypothetical protein
MGLLFWDQFEWAGSDLPRDVSRESFRAGIKAAYIVGQLNRLGQVLCSSCGHAWSDLATAFDDLEVRGLCDAGTGYSGGVEMGVDHPNNLVLRCWRCAKKEVAIL